MHQAGDLASHEGSAVDVAGHRTAKGTGEFLLVGAAVRFLLKAANLAGEAVLQAAHRMA